MAPAALVPGGAQVLSGAGDGAAGGAYWSENYAVQIVSKMYAPCANAP